MATYVWAGSPNQTTNVDGTTANAVSGGTAGHTWLSTRNYWGLTANWRRRVGGSTGWGGVFYHPAVRTPSGGDHVILESIPANIGSNGNDPERWVGDTADWPQSELLYGGVSGSGMWDGVIGDGETATNLINLEVKQSYYRNSKWTLNEDGITPHHGPLNVMRLGTTRLYNPVGSYVGLNIFTNNFTSNSEPVNNRPVGSFNLVTLIGAESKINNVTVNGVGKYFVKTAYCETILVDGEAWDQDDFEGKSLNYAHFGDLGDASVYGLINIGCKTLDQFNWIPVYGSTAAKTTIGCNAKRMPNRKGAVNIHGPFYTLTAAPWENYPGNYATGGAKIAIKSTSANAQTSGTVFVREYNPFHSVSYDSDHNNSGVSFNNNGGTDTITTLKIEAGVFETDDLNAPLIISGGEINEEGTLDLRARKSGGTIEVAGMSGGQAGDGMLNASGNSTILLPDGVNFSFREIAGGATGALFAANAVAQRSGKA